MKNEKRWSQIGVRLGLVMLALIVLTGCTRVILECPSSATMKNPTGPTGCPHGQWPNGSCKP